MVINYVEQVRSQSPGTAGFALDGARASWQYDVGPFDVADALVDVLGTTDTAVSADGRMTRKLPKAHPQFPWMYAERVANLQGVGKPTTFNITDSFECPLLVQQIALYQRYRLTIDFLPRPYYVVADANIPVATESWVDEDGLAQVYQHTREYVRFTDYDVLPDVDVVTAQHGMMRFRGTTPEKAFTGMPRVTVAKAVVKFRWFAIPFRYVESSNSYLANYANRVNQFDFWQWPAGSLLYRSFSILRKWTPIVPDTNPVFGTTAFTPDKLCDVELLWEFTSRKLAAPPPAPANGNWVQAGHNLMPNYADRGFYYVSTDNPNPALQVPLFLSVPFQLLFTDPDS
jgi:hypothetical protein